ncbi:MAG: ATP-binding cassette domain-containing protein [Gammaproteobacteria bacterium]|nr:ATP-binding cassette domain-containing protein [Gammaproteobacteria bacterium]
MDVEGLDVVYSLDRPRLFAPRPKLQAVTTGTFTISPGETLGVVGESGCGKSSLARAVIGLVPPSAGRVTLLGGDLQDADKKTWMAARRNMQMIFQDPLASLNPRMTARQIVGEPLGACRPDLSRTERDERVVRILNRVGLADGQLDRYPHEFSGGQCQRIGIARALAPGPAVVICDEAVSALDVSIRAQIVDLLMELQDELGLALIFIAHDLAVVRQISHRVVVMYLGRAMEVAQSEHLYARPMHPYTRALIEAAPIPDPAVERSRKRELLEGEPPSPLNPPPGCAFSARCNFAIDRCRQETPQLRTLSQGMVACHRAEEIAARRA